MTPTPADLSQVPPQVRVALHIQFLYLQAMQGGTKPEPESVTEELFNTSCRALTAYMSGVITPPPDAPKPAFVPGNPMPKRDMWAGGGPKPVGPTVQPSGG